MFNGNGTRCSQAVTRPSTNRAQRGLTSVIGRELVHSTRGVAVADALTIHN